MPPFFTTKRHGQPTRGGTHAPLSEIAPDALPEVAVDPRAVYGSRKLVDGVTRGRNTNAKDRVDPRDAVPGLGEAAAAAAGGEGGRGGAEPPPERTAEPEGGEEGAVVVALRARVREARGAILERLAKYQELTHPLVEHYGARGLLTTFAGTESNVIYPEMHAHVTGLGVAPLASAK